MKLRIISLCLYVFLLSGCLLTHRDIRQKSLTVREEDTIEEDQALESKQEEGRKQIVSQTTTASTGKAQPSSLAEQMAEMATSLRELRGEITHSDKEREEQLSKLKQGLISLIQALDLRVTALAGEVEKLKKSPDSNQKQSNTFQKAEQLFQEKKWKSAIIHYEKYRAQDKQGKFYKESTLKIGLCFQKLEMHKEAKVFFREIVESFPKSESAKTAQKLLAPPSTSKP